MEISWFKEEHTVYSCNIGKVKDILHQSHGKSEFSNCLGKTIYYEDLIGIYYQVIVVT